MLDYALALLADVLAVGIIPWLVAGLRKKTNDPKGISWVIYRVCDPRPRQIVCLHGQRSAPRHRNYGLRDLLFYHLLRWHDYLKAPRKTRRICDWGSAR